MRRDIYDDDEDISFSSMIDKSLPIYQKSFDVLIKEIGYIKKSLYVGRWDVLNNIVDIDGEIIYGIQKPEHSNRGCYYEVVRSGWYRGVFFMGGYNIISDGDKWLLYMHSDEMTICNNDIQ